MNNDEGMREARRFADTSYSAQLQEINRKFDSDLDQVRNELATRGLVRSSAMVREMARIDGERITAMLQARLDSLLEGFELHEVAISDLTKESLVDEFRMLREKYISVAVDAYRTDSAVGGLVPVPSYTPVLEKNISISESSVKVQIDRKRFMKKSSASGVTNIYHIHGHNARWVTNGTDRSVNIVTVSSEQIFADLRKEIESAVPHGDERKDVLDKLAALEQAQNSPTFAKRYSDFIATAANYMTLIGPFIPALTELLHRTL